MVSRFITKPVMMPKFRLFRRAKTFWCEDAKSGRQQSLGTKTRATPHACSTGAMRPMPSPSPTSDRYASPG